ncbi:hypothetical protein PsYK624_080520 [Phanerochaete sordida]|uniref:Uncharacterized protein n=1 Tax=Phanerochaete sordida TaxID=48140 RepID=A0A9P3LDV7_9APHY|nr:hypothetical protein PsYK624_080520 [Phanerochaete sordida]
MHLHTVFDWVAREVFEWLLRLILVVSVQRQRLRAERCKQVACYIMPPDGPSTLLDAVCLVLPVVVGIVEWSRSLASILKSSEDHDASARSCSRIHRWLVQISVRDDLLADVLGCPCLAGHNRLTSITLHLPVPAEDVTSPCSSPSRAKRSLPTLCLDDTPSRKRSIDMRTPSSATFAVPSTPERKRSRHTRNSGRRSSWASSVGTLVDDADRALELNEGVGKSWDEEACAGAEVVVSPPSCADGDVQDVKEYPSMAVDDEPVSSVEPDDEECGDDSDSGCCVSPCYKARSLMDGENDTSTHHPSLPRVEVVFSDTCFALDSPGEPPPFREAPAAHASLLDLFDPSTRLPFWSRVFKLVLPCSSL